MFCRSGDRRTCFYNLTSLIIANSLYVRVRLFSRAHILNFAYNGMQLNVNILLCITYNGNICVFFVMHILFCIYCAHLCLIYIYIYVTPRPGGTNFLSVLCMSCAYCGLTVKLDLTSFQSFAPAYICENCQSSDPLNPHYSMFPLDKI